MIEPSIWGVLLLYVFHAISLYILIPSRYSRLKTAAILFGGFVVSFGFCWMMVLWSTSTLSMGIAFIATVLLAVATALLMSAYDIPKTMFLFLIYAQAFVIVMILSAFISQRFFGGSSLAVVLVRTGLHIAILLLCAVLRKKFDFLVHGIIRGWGMLDLVEILCFTYTGLFVLRVYDKPYGTTELVAFVLFLLIIIAVYIVFYNTIRYMYRANLQEQAELQSKFLLEQMKAMQESMEETRRLRHDARHHNLQIAEYVRTGETDALLEYLHEYESEAEDHLTINLCENLAANNILSVYAYKAEQSEIAVRFDVSMEQDIKISDVDIVAILANLMENAIHGCLRSKKQNPEIYVYIASKKNKLAIYVRNTSDENVIFENGLPKSKGGIGVTSILHSAARYGGESDFRNEDGMFTCQLLLKIPEK